MDPPLCDLRTSDFTRRTFLKAAAGTALLATGCASETSEPPRTIGAAAAPAKYSIPSPDALTHLLKRATYGVSNADLEHARAIGADRWLEEQLAPESITDPTEAIVRSRFPLTLLTRAEVVAQVADLDTPVKTQHVEATVFRACHSPRQLYELMVEFWSNHFNVDARELRYLKLFDDREVIRPHTLGRFRDLLHASAKSPAMLVYLDNDSNTQAGPNENYARELLELHTLGVHGGYTEDDVREVARCFTGWTFNYRTLEFWYRDEKHDNGDKVVLGQTVGGAGLHEGEQVLDMLARHPATAHHLATKLCRRFVADDPPASLIERVAQVFVETDGDIPGLLRTIFTADEFRAATGAKMARPMEFVAGCIRAVAPDPARYLADITPSQALRLLGQRPFEWAPPNGYPDTDDFWLSTMGLVERWRFATSLAETRVNDRSHGAELAGSAATPTELVDTVSARIVPAGLRPAHRAALIELAASGGSAARSLSATERQAGAEAVTGLLLSSPYFLVR